MKALEAAHRKWKQAEAELATAQAQVAVMAEALQAVEFGTEGYGDCHWCGATVGLEGIGHYPDCQRQQALSAAPKAVWSGEAEVKHSIHEGTWLLLKSKYSTLFLGEEGQVRKVIVLDKGEGE